MKEILSLLDETPMWVVTVALFIAFVVISVSNKKHIIDFLKKFTIKKLEKFILKFHKENLLLSILFIVSFSFALALILSTPTTNFITSQFPEDKKEFATFPFIAENGVEKVGIDIDPASIFAAIFTVFAAGIVVMMNVLKENEKKEKEQLQAFIGFEPVPIQDFFIKKTKKLHNNKKEKLKFRKGSRVVELDKVKYVQGIERYVYNILRKGDFGTEESNESHPLLFALINRAEVGVLPISVDIIFKKIDIDEFNDKKVDKKRKIRLTCGYAIKEDMKKYGLLSPYPHEDFLFMAATKAMNADEIKLEYKQLPKSIEIMQESQEDAKNSFLEYQTFYKEIFDSSRINKNKSTDFLIVVTFAILGDEKKYSKAFEALFKLKKVKSKKKKEEETKDNESKKDKDKKVSKKENEDVEKKYIGYIEAIAPMLNEEELEKKYGLDDIKGLYDNFISRKY